MKLFEKYINEEFRVGSFVKLNDEGIDGMYVGFFDMNKEEYVKDRSFGEIIDIKILADDLIYFQIRWEDGNVSHYPKKYVELINKKRKLNLDEDPFGGEDWGCVQENLDIKKFNVGDKVQLQGIVTNKDLDGKTDVICELGLGTVRTNYNEYGLCDEYIYHGKLYLLKYNDWFISPYNIVGINLKKRKLNLDEDPFGEEDWGYVQENFNLKDHEIGEKVILRGKVSDVDVQGVVGEILQYAKVNSVNTNYNEYGLCHEYSYRGEAYLMKMGELGTNWYIPPYNIEENFKNKKRILNLDEDPFGEENWGFVQEEYKYFKFGKGEDNFKDPKEPFFNFQKKKYFKLREYLNKHFAPFLTFKKYLKYKEELEHVGIKFDEINDFTFKRLSPNPGIKIWKINSKMIIYFISDSNRIMVECPEDRTMIPRNENDEFDVEKAIEYFKKRYGANRKNYDKYKAIDPFGEEDWSKTSEQFDWWDDDPFGEDSISPEELKIGDKVKILEPIYGHTTDSIGIILDDKEGYQSRVYFVEDMKNSVRWWYPGNKLKKA